MKNKIYITGATGKVGRAVLEKTRAIPLVRKPAGLKNEIVTDFSAEELKKILKDAEVVLHIAGSIDTLDTKKMWRANVGLTRRLVAAVPKKCRIVFAGSIAVYGKKLAQIPADEKTEPRPDSAYAKSKYQAEKIVERHNNHVVLRIGPVYGPGFTDYSNVLSLIKKGRMRIIGDGKNRMSFVHVDDVADAFRKAIRKGKGAYIISGESLLQEEVYAAAAQQLGVPPPSKRIGRDIALFFAGMEEWKARFTGKKPVLTREHIGILGFDRVFDTGKAKKELGFRPRPLRKGIVELVKAYQEKFN